MYRISFIFFLIMIGILPTQAQQKVGIEEILLEGKQHFPLAGRDSLIAASAELGVKNLNNRYLPSMSLEGKASWQSDVTTISLPIPGVSFPEFPKDQYKVYVDIKQMVFDGGLTKSAKEAELLKADMMKNQTETAYAPLFHQLNSIFHGILLLNENEKSLKGYLIRLEDQEKQLQQLAANGMGKPAQLSEIKIEQLKLRQNLEEIAFNRKDALDALYILTGKHYDANQLEASGSRTASLDAAISRPEISMLDQQIKLNQLQKKIQQQQRLPKVAAFAQLGYGKPALNMFSTDFKEYAIAGLSASWNIYDWGEAKNNQKKFDLESAQKEQDKTAFLQNTKIKLQSYQNQQDKLKSQSETQQELVSLRKTVVNDKEIQVREGSLLSKFYLDELNQLMVDEIKLNELSIKQIQNRIDMLIEQGELH